jgi:hypothetical protein
VPGVAAQGGGTGNGVAPADLSLLEAEYTDADDDVGRVRGGLAEVDVHGK